MVGFTDRWNRAVVVFVALFILAGGIITLLVATDAVAPGFPPGGSGDPPSGSWFQPQLESLAGYSGSDLVITIIVAAIVALAMLGVILLEVKPARSGSTLLISSTKEGGLTIEEDSVRHLAERTGSSNRQIESLRCRLRVRGRRSAIPASIIIVCYPRVILGSNVQEIRDDLQTRVKEAVENLTGLTVLQVNVARVRYERGDSPRLMGA